MDGKRLEWGAKEVDAKEQTRQEMTCGDGKLSTHKKRTGMPGTAESSQKKKKKKLDEEPKKKNGGEKKSNIRDCAGYGK